LRLLTHLTEVSLPLSCSYLATLPAQHAPVLTAASTL